VKSQVNVTTDNDWGYILQQRFLDETTRVKGGMDSKKAS
jgi:hypothetical protein